MTSTLGDFTATVIDGDEVDLSTYAGQVVLVVNIASQCGLTPQYAGLQGLYETSATKDSRYRFPVRPVRPPGARKRGEIAQFCETSYGVTFPMFAKVDVNGDGAHPLYPWLRREGGGRPEGAEIEWNFIKFLLGRDGQVLARYAHRRVPGELRPDVEKALAEVPSLTVPPPPLLSLSR